ncbi:MAG: hypothetical protein KDD44_01805 [Bdellovibrionales bacterium]|nr:hypothetical protein [Bdellovibrionales bacterium]
MNSYLSHIVRFLISVIATVASASAQDVTGDECRNWRDAHPAWLWCDDFESKAPLEARYREFQSDGGAFRRTTKDSRHGRAALKATWKEGDVRAGSLMQTFGRNPIGSQIRPTDDFSEVYWRLYLKLADGFTGSPGKITRTTILANRSWAQAMIAHVWFHGSKPGYIVLDPATGIGPTSELQTTHYNDFPHLRWLGQEEISQPLKPGKWYCIETHVRLNSPGRADGLFELWLNGKLQRRRDNLNWRGRWNDYGLNAVMVSNYWNEGSPRKQSRFIDSFVVSTKPIGCLPIDR